MTRLASWARDGLTFDVRDTGPVDATDVVVCLHGFPQDGTAYSDVAGRLTAEGLRVLVPDQRGYSPRARPTARTAYALDVLADDIVHLLDAAGVEQAHVVGHDWGGAVAWQLGSRHADRVRSLAVLSTPHPAALWSGGLRSSQPLRSVYLGFFQLPFLPELVTTAAGGMVLRQSLTRSGLRPDQADHYVARMREPGAMTAALGWYRALPVIRGRGPGRVTVPTTYVVGRRDPFFSAGSVARTAAYVTGRFRQVELDAGHWLPESRPGEVVAAVRAQVERLRPAG